MRALLYLFDKQYKQAIDFTLHKIPSYPKLHSPEYSNVMWKSSRDHGRNVGMSRKGASSLIENQADFLEVLLAEAGFTSRRVVDTVDTAHRPAVNTLISKIFTKNAVPDYASFMNLHNPNHEFGTGSRTYHPDFLFWLYQKSREALRESCSTILSVLSQIARGEDTLTNNPTNASFSKFIRTAFHELGASNIEHTFGEVDVLLFVFGKTSEA